MKVFVTGASGFIGSAIVAELIAHGHEVVGLARSEASAQKIEAAGASVHRGALDDLESLRDGAASADAVIHTAFIHDFSNFAAAAEVDRQAIAAIGEMLAGSGRPFVVTSGIGLLQSGKVGVETDEADLHSAGAHRGASETLALGLAAQGVRVSLVRLPTTVHGAGDHGFVPALIDIARNKGVSAYPAEGSNRWPAVHRLDAARLYRLALEHGAAGSKFHGVAEAGIPVREIATVIGRRLHLPIVSLPTEEATQHFGWLARFFLADISASSAWTQQQLDWHPTGPTLLEDLEQPYYFESN